MRVNKLLKIADAGYDSDVLVSTVNSKSGDTLALFINHEIKSVYDPNEATEDQLASVMFALQSASLAMAAVEREFAKVRLEYIDNKRMEKDYITK